MFPNLKAEMARRGITQKMIAELLGKSESWVDNALRGKSNLPLIDGVKIKNEFFKEVDIEILFSDSVIVPNYEKVV